MPHSPTLRQRLARLAALVRYHRPAQLARRAANVARRRVLGRNGSVFLPGWPQELPQLREHTELPTIAQRLLALRRPDQARAVADRFARNRIRLLNVEADLGQPAGRSTEKWLTEKSESRAADSQQRLSHLWRFQYHYHEFLLDVAQSALPKLPASAAASSSDSLPNLPASAADSPPWGKLPACPPDSPQPGKLAACPTAIWQFIRAWIEAQPITDRRGHDDAWHPFCVSRRLAVWTALWHAAPAPSDPDPILRSVLQQARFLARNFEWDLAGNHLLENLRGLALAGAFLSGREADAWLERVARLLPAQLDEQVLEHGEHFERSPMYHALTLASVLDLADALRPVAPAVSARCTETAQRMADFLESILHPDGEIPLLADSAFGEAPPPRPLIDQARSTGCQPAPPRSTRVDRSPSSQPAAPSLSP